MDKYRNQHAAMQMRCVTDRPFDKVGRTQSSNHQRREDDAGRDRADGRKAEPVARRRRRRRRRTARESVLAPSTVRLAADVGASGSGRIAAEGNRRVAISGAVPGTGLAGLGRRAHAVSAPNALASRFDAARAVGPAARVAAPAHRRVAAVRDGRVASCRSGSSNAVLWTVDAVLSRHADAVSARRPVRVAVAGTVLAVLATGADEIVVARRAAERGGSVHRIRGRSSDHSRIRGRRRRRIGRRGPARTVGIGRRGIVRTGRKARAGGRAWSGNPG